MVRAEPGRSAQSHRRVSAFLCGTFVLALGLVLVLDPPDDDDDLPLGLSAAGLSEAPATAGAQAAAGLKVAKPHKLKPRKTALKKRGKRFFYLHESGPPVQGNQRPRRGTQIPHLALPDPAADFTVPALTLARLRPSGAAPLPGSPQLRQQLIRGPPAVVLL